MLVLMPRKVYTPRLDTVKAEAWPWQEDRRAMSRERKRIEADRKLLVEARVIHNTYGGLPLLYPEADAVPEAPFVGPPAPERRRTRR